MKYLVMTLLLFTLSTGFAQSGKELARTAIEFEDIKEFLSDKTKGEIYLRDGDGFVSLQGGTRKSSLDANESSLTLEKIVEQGEKYKLRFNIDEYVYGKVTILSIKGELQVRRASLKAGEGKDKSRMVTLEF